MGERYRTLGIGGTVCLVLHYCSLLCSFTICFSGFLPLALVMLASIATLWLVNRPAFVLGILAVAAQGVSNGLLILGAFLFRSTDSVWGVGPEDVLFNLVLVVLLVNALSLVFLLVRRRAFGVGVGTSGTGGDKVYKEPWED